MPPHSKHSLLTDIDDCIPNFCPVLVIYLIEGEFVKVTLTSLLTLFSTHVWGVGIKGFPADRFHHFHTFLQVRVQVKAVVYLSDDSPQLTLKLSNIKCFCHNLAGQLYNRENTFTIVTNNNTNTQNCLKKQNITFVNKISKGITCIYLF